MADETLDYENDLDAADTLGTEEDEAEGTDEEVADGDETDD